VARQICRGFEREGVSTVEAKARIFLIDSRGLILRDRPGLEAYKQEFAQSPERIAGWAIKGAAPSLLETVQRAKVTTLIGLSGQRGAFSEDVIISIAANTLHPTVFALSNPTANCEVTPEDVYQWTKGRATVATGSPFPDVVYAETRRSIGQGNNAFIFPGLGLGVLLSGARRVTDTMVTAAAVALAECTGAERLASGGVYPPVEKLRNVSKQVAAAVIRQAIADGVAKDGTPDRQLEAFVEQRMWRPTYLPIRRGET
jgi:malate dehydrogenase (oxaloacetate-decarboxylating)